MNRTTKFYYSLILLSLLVSCQGVENRLQIKSKALGVMNDIVVICDEDIWFSAVGDTIKYLFEGVYPLTPRPEPIFDLRQFTVEDITLQPLKKELRTYMVVANLADKDSETTQMVRKDLGEERYQRALVDPTFTTSVGKDKWAHGQIILYVFANGVDNLTKAIESNFDKLSSRVNEHDAFQLFQTTYARGKNEGLKKELLEKYGAEITIPMDFKRALEKPEEDKLIWFKKDTKDGAMNIVIRQYDYTGPDMLTPEAAKKRFDAFGIYVSSAQPETYIVINNQDLPVLTFDRIISGHYAREFRGIWEMENDFFGGPYQGYAIVNEVLGKMITLDGFIFAPGRRKRDMMQQIDTIAKNIKW